MLHHSINHAICRSAKLDAEFLDCAIYAKVDVLTYALRLPNLLQRTALSHLIFQALHDLLLHVPIPVVCGSAASGSSSNSERIIGEGIIREFKDNKDRVLGRTFVAVLSVAFNSSITYTEAINFVAPIARTL